MTRRLASLLLTLASLLAPALAAQTTDPDETAVRSVMQQMSDAWDQHDMRAWTSYMTDDVQWVNIVGMWWRGKDEVFRAHDAFHRTIFKDRTFDPPETVALRHVTPDTIIVNLVQHTGAFTSPGGHQYPAARNILTEVFIRQNGRWLLTAGQNTVIDEAAQKSNPVAQKQP